MSLQGDVLIGRQAPTIEHLPPDVAGNPAGDDAVELAELAGLDLDRWQAYVLRTSLSERPDGLWSAFLVAVVVARQNGKGSILEARELAGLFLLGEQLILHSAHEFRTCYEHFLRILRLIEQTPELDRQVMRVRRGAGEQAVELRNGNRLRFIARSGGSGRGMSAPCVVLDEAMFLTDAQVGAIMPTLSAQENPQLWYTSSAPLAQSEPLHRLRKAAIDGDAGRTFYAEWGNDADADPHDAEAIARANPALGRRVWFDFIETERDTMSPTEFARERLGVPEVPASQSGPVDLERWESLTDGESLPSGQVRLALDVPPHRMSAVFAIAGRRDDNLWHGSVRLEVQPADMPRLVELAKQLTEGHETALVLPPGPARSWRAQLVEAGVDVDEMAPAEYAEACGAILAAINDGSFRHRGQPVLNAAVGGLASRASGDVETWSRRSSSANISPFVALTCAFGRVPTTKPATKPKAKAWARVG